MTSGEVRAVLAPAASTGSVAAVAADTSSQEKRFDAGPLWMRVLPPAVTLAVMLLGVTVPSYWRDEAATLAAIRRPFGAMIRMLGNVDAVHGSYYVLMWGLSRIFGYGELAMRFPSVIAMTVAAAFVAALGRRVFSPGAGLAAGLLFAVVPDISLYGQDARSYALVTMMGAIASYLLVRALGRAGPELPSAAALADAGTAAAPARPRGWIRRHGWWIGYAASLSMLGILNIFGLLLIPAHALTMLIICRRPIPGASRRRLALAWLACAVIATVVTSPLLRLGYQQRGQISWLTSPGYSGLVSVTKLLGPQLMSLGVFLVVVAAIVAVAVRSPGGLASSRFGPLSVLAVPWLVLPPALLLGASVITPVYTFRYILFCIPAAVLLGGAALASLWRPVAVLAFIAIVALGFSGLVGYRQPGGHGDNIRQADMLISISRQPGDVVYYPNPNAESFGAAYPKGLGQLRNIETGRGAIASGTLGGTNVSTAVLRQRLAHVHRLWVVEIDSSSPAGSVLHGLHFHLQWFWQSSDIWLKLYVRYPPSAGHAR
jgi:mannosyltransferase